MIKKIKIYYYKCKLRKAYIKYCNNAYDSGLNLQNYITGDKDLCNYYINKLKTLGENINNIA